MARKQVNPDMVILGSPGVDKEATREEKESAKMPNVGTFPTGKKAAVGVEVKSS